MNRTWFRRRCFEPVGHGRHFAGTTEAELRNWLREILKNQITDTVRFNHRQQRSVQREGQCLFTIRRVQMRLPARSSGGLNRQKHSGERWLSYQKIIAP